MGFFQFENINTINDQKELKTSNYYMEPFALQQLTFLSPTCFTEHSNGYSYTD